MQYKVEGDSLSLNDVYDYIDEHSQDFLRKLTKLVRQPSISATGEGIGECAQMVRSMLSEVGFTTKNITEKKGYPVVFGELKSKASAKTLLFYNHYDVQPPEPLDEWSDPPFSGRVYRGRIYGRGAADNKGNLISRICAVEAFLETAGDVPVNVKIVVDGEEEIGSPNFLPIIRQHSKLFRNDATIWEFGGTNFEGRPEIYLGLKGVLSVELKAEDAIRDAHSANAPLIPNPAWRLVWILNTLKNEEDKILIEGFYDNVQPPSQEEIQLLEDIPLEEEKLKKTFGLKEFLHNKSGIEAKESLLFSPTCTINGIHTGYTGPGSKTVLPNKASAKLDFRLVPNQTPNEVFEKLVAHLRTKGIGKVKALRHGSTEPSRTPLTDKFVGTVAKAAERVYRKKAVIYPTSAGSGPMHLFRNWLRSPVVSAGCGHAESKAHAPNENLSLEGFTKGTKFMATVLNDFGGSTSTTKKRE